MNVNEMNHPFNQVHILTFIKFVREKARLFSPDFMDQGAMVLEEGAETSPDPHSEGKQERGERRGSPRSRPRYMSSSISQ